MIPLSDWCTPVLLSGWTIHGGGELLLIAASAGAVGMGLSDIASGLSDRISGGGGDDEPEFAGDDEFGGGGGFGDEFSGGGGFDDDEFGGFDDDDGDDLDDWSGDEGLDDFGGGGGGANSDLEPRLDELENEVATISSTMGTVRSENEAINETVEDIEDNIRKLLDIYEMVTRGVNPFVDDAQASGGMGGSFGLFDDADDDDGFDDLDPDVADADADSFFDDDFDADSFDEEEEFEDDNFPMGDEDTPSAGADHGTADEGVAPADAGAGSADGDEGKTFDELKSEYETGVADWDADDEPEADPDASVPDQEPEEATDADDATPPEGVDTAPDPADLGGAEAAAKPAESSPESEAGDASEPSDGADSREGSPDASTAADDKPYLESLPSGYGAELLVVEWLTYLRGRSSTSEALRAINYYRNIGWIGAPAANSLQEYLSGLVGGEVTPASTGGTQLTIDHHTDSLRYIGKLCGKHVDVERLEWSGSGRDGSRIERRGQRGIQR